MDLLNSDGKKPGEEWTWDENVAMCAARFSKKIEDAWVFEMGKADAFLPHHHIASEQTQEKEAENRIRQLEIFIDYFIGTQVAILTHYASLEEEFEENLIAMVKDKFERLRKRNANGHHQA